jgi:hypothetical protein
VKKDAEFEKRLFGDIKYVQEALSNLGAKAFEEKRYKDAEGIASASEKLVEIEKAISERITHGPHTWSGFPGKKILEVKFQDGNVFNDPVVTNTFLKTLEHIGLERIENLGIRLCGIPLVSDTKVEKYTQHQINGHYVMTHSDTETKRRILEEISRHLDLGLKIEVIYPGKA